MFFTEIIFSFLSPETHGNGLRELTCNEKTCEEVNHTLQSEVGLLSLLACHIFPTFCCKVKVDEHL